MVRCGNALLDEGSSVVSGQAYELGRGLNFSINEIADMFGKDYPKKYISARGGEYPFTLADYTKAKKNLNWKPKISFDDLVIDMVEHDLENIDKPNL